MADGKKTWTGARKSSNEAADKGRKARKEARRQAQDLRARYNKQQGPLGSPWSNAKADRAEGRKGKSEQPRTEIGHIIKRDPKTGLSTVACDHRNHGKPLAASGRPGK